MQKILQRLEQLEAKEAEHEKQDAATTAKTVEKLQARIAELESKLAALESGKVLPEIAVTPPPGPTVQELDQKIRVVERKNEIAAEAAVAKAAEAPHFSIGKNGVTWSSADTNFVMKLRGVVQVDSRTHFGDNPELEGNDTFLLRRVRPTLEGTLYGNLDFNLTPDFAGAAPALFDTYLQYRIRPEIQIRAGKFKSPIGLEMSFGGGALAFNERSLVTSLVPNRTIGVQLGGDLGGGLASYAAGIFNGTGDARNSGSTDFGDDKQLAGRVFLHPFKNRDNRWLKELGLGVGGSYSQVYSNTAALPANTGGILPGYATDSQQQYFAYNPLAGTVFGDGNHWRISPQGYYLAGPFGLVGEYAISHQSVINGTTLKRAELEHSAWNLTAQWVVTGEPATISVIDPIRPFRLHGDGWGAWQLVARYGKLDIDPNSFQGFSNPNASAGGATAWSVGVNWSLNRNLRIQTSFSRTTFNGGGAPLNFADPSTLVPPGLVTQQPENVLLTRIQLAF